MAQPNFKEIEGKNMALENRKEPKIGLHQKCLLTLEEAALLTGLGKQKLRELSNFDNCEFVLWNGNKRMFKRKKLEEYLYRAYSI